MGGILSRAEGTKLVGGGGGLEAPKRYFQHLICLRKIHLEYENGKQLQVIMIKIAESKENKSIHRLDHDVT